MKRILIGSNNKTGVLEKDKAYGVIKNYAKGFTSYQATGFWEGKKEKSLVIELDRISSTKAGKLARELARVLKQDAIGVQDIKTSIKFVN